MAPVISRTAPGLGRRDQVLGVATACVGAVAWYRSVTCVHPTAAMAASVSKIALQSRCVMRAPSFFVDEA